MFIKLEIKCLSSEADKTNEKTIIFDTQKIEGTNMANQLIRHLTSNIVDQENLDLLDKLHRLTEFIECQRESILKSYGELNISKDYKLIVGEATEQIIK